ncbi:hypothetical protein LCGC14_2005720, partial [marine sediment metagenome]
TQPDEKSQDYYTSVSLSRISIYRIYSRVERAEYQSDILVFFDEKYVYTN